MENNTKEYKEERFEFALYVNENIICKRNFRIFNFIEGSMETIDFKEKVDEIVSLVDEDLKSKSRVYTWYYYNDEYPEWCEEFSAPLIEPWQCTFKLTISDNKREVISKIWDGYAYPKAIREKVDLSNKYVRVTNKDGQVFVYDKEAYFSANEGRLSPEMAALKAMIMDKGDVLLQITKKICEACSPSKEDVKENGKLTYKTNKLYLDGYTQDERYGDKTYSYSIQAANKKVESAWAKALSEKTKEYMKNLYV